MASETMTINLNLVCIPSELLVAIDHVLHVQAEILDGEIAAEYRIRLTKEEALSLAQLVGYASDQLAKTKGTGSIVVIDSRECEGKDA